MRVDDLIVEVRRADLSRAGQVSEDDLVGARFEPRHNDIGDWTLTLPQLNSDGSEHLECAALREEGAGIIVTGPSGVIISGRWLTSKWEADSRNMGGVWRFEGISDLDEVEAALAFPDPGNPNPGNQSAANDVRTGPAETLIHEYVDANRGPSAPSIRRSPVLDLGPDLGRGPVRTTSPRFTNLLTLCQEITVGTNIGFDVVQAGDRLELVTRETADLSALVRWDIDNDQLARAVNERIAPRATHAIVAGQGEGTERTIVLRSSTQSEAAAAVWGRRERFIDQRQTDVLEELNQAGDAEVDRAGTLQAAYRVTPAPDVVDRFGDEWKIGDIITAVIGDVEIPLRVTGASIGITNQGLIVAAILGDEDELDPATTLLRRTASRVSQLERNAEVGGIPVGAHLPGEWSPATVPSGYLLPDGATHLIADYPRLAAHYAAVYGSANFHGGNGTTTFAVPDTRERVYVNQGGSDIFAAIGAKTGAKTHTLTASQIPEVPIRPVSNSISRVRLTDGTFNLGSSGTLRVAVGGSSGENLIIEGGGQAHNIVQPSFVCRYVIRAA